MGATAEDVFTPSADPARRLLAVLGRAGLTVFRREVRYRFHDPDTEPLERIATRWLRPDPRESTP
ncbi:hypothetical protein ACH47C_30335 [Streptomyces rishiriensis]|uniref:hypothetical protein n=1 Tax=Streptomyces rishiriensis TaxID=68264 RepID=UPI0033E9CCD2